MVKKFFQQLVSEESTDKMIRVLFSWRLIFLGAFIGVLLGLLVYRIFPPDFRAQATVNVDQNLEEAWVYFPDRQLFHFLERETLKLEEIAWSDETLNKVVAEVSGFSLTDLRSGVLYLSYPEDGPWHFQALHPQAEVAQALASTWAKAFSETAWAAVEISPALEQARDELENLLAADPDTPWEEISPYWTLIDDLHQQAKGVSPYLEVTLSQAESVPVSRLSNAYYMLGGSVLGVLSLMFIGLFVQKPEASNV